MPVQQLNKYLNIELRKIYNTSKVDLIRAMEYGYFDYISYSSMKNDELTTQHHNILSQCSLCQSFIITDDDFTCKNCNIDDPYLHVITSTIVAFDKIPNKYWHGMIIPEITQIDKSNTGTEQNKLAVDSKLTESLYTCDSINNLQELVNDKNKLFDWTKHLSSKEINFVNAIVSKKNTIK